MDIADVLQLCHLLFDLLQDIVVTGSHDGDPGDAGICRNACGDALNVVASAGKQSGNTAQYTGGVVDQKLEYFLLHDEPLFQ